MEVQRCGYEKESLVGDGGIRVSIFVVAPAAAGGVASRIPSEGRTHGSRHMRRK